MIEVGCDCGGGDGWHRAHCRSLVWSKLEHRFEPVTQFHFYRRDMAHAQKHGLV